MIIRLPKDLEQIVHDAVRAGLYAHEDDVIRDVLTKLKKTLPKSMKTPAKKAKLTKAESRESKKPVTEAEIQQYMLHIGLMTQLPNTAVDFDDPDDVPITIKGEPISETIIRERR
jgi:Arc/MetJ-type ribon-helix-helix transcriptional regulator